MYVSLSMCQAFELSSKGNTGMSHQKKNAYALTDPKENENKWDRMEMHTAITYMYISSNLWQKYSNIYGN